MEREKQKVTELTIRYCQFSDFLFFSFHVYRMGINYIAIHIKIWFSTQLAVLL